MKMKLPVLGSEDGEFCPCFYIERAADETDKEFVSEVEASSSMIIGEISKREYLSCHAIGGTMPRLNLVFEEMTVKYEERKIPEKILKSIEEKVAKATKSDAAPVATARAQSRKRKEADAPKTVAKKRKLAKISKDATAEEMAESTHDGPDATRPSTEAG